MYPQNQTLARCKRTNRAFFRNEPSPGANLTALKYTVSNNQNTKQTHTVFTSETVNNNCDGDGLLYTSLVVRTIIFCSTNGTGRSNDTSQPLIRDAFPCVFWGKNGETNFRASKTNTHIKRLAIWRKACAHELAPSQFQLQIKAKPKKMYIRTEMVTECKWMRSILIQFSKCQPPLCVQWWPANVIAL